MRFWVGVGSAFGLGAVLGFSAAWILLEEKISKDYNESLESMQRVFQMASRKSADEEWDLNEVAVTPIDEGSPLDTGTVEIVKDGDIQSDFKPADKSPYWEGATPTSIEDFVEGNPNEYGISYIEEEEYLEDDGRAKCLVEVMMDDMFPVFMMDGVEIDDWADRVGPSIVQDMINLVPPGLRQVLYVRNHKTDEDYEVVRVSP